MSPRAGVVVCMDSVGYGGAEKTLLRVLGWIAPAGLELVCPRSVDPRVEAALEAKGIVSTRVPDSAGGKMAVPLALWRALRLVAARWRAVFVVWSHHHDSNRWLQVVLAVTGRRFFLVERVVAASRDDFARSRLSLPLKRFVAPRAWAVILNARSQIEGYRAIFRVPRATVLAIANSRPVDRLHRQAAQLRTDRPALRRSLGLGDGLVILCVARLTDQKDQATLIRALAQSGVSADLVLVGDGEDRASLEKLGADLLPGRLLLAGHQADPLPWLAAADLFALPSVFEGLPGALLEAMAAGLPCIATDIPGNRDLVVHEETGLLVAPRSPADLAHAIRRLADDDGLARRLGAAGLSRVREHHDEPGEAAAWGKILGGAAG